MRRFKLLVASMTVAAVAVVAVLSVASSASAYGNTAQYQVAVSFNCDNPKPGACDQFDGTGGFWAWYEFDNNWTGDATGTGCGHTPGAGGPGLAGAGHENVDITAWEFGPAQPGDIDYSSIPAQNGTNFYIVHDMTTFVGHGGSVTVPDQNVGDTGVPAAPGHYNVHLGAGIQAQIQVSQIPNR